MKNICFFFIILLLSIIGCVQTTQKFTSPQGVYSLEYPNTWTYAPSPDIDGTMMFWKREGGMGTLRITPLIAGPDAEKSVNEIILEDHAKISGSVLTEKNGITSLHWSESTQEDGENLIMYYWILGKEDNMILISLTTLEIEKENPNTILHLKTAQEIVGSIAIN